MLEHFEKPIKPHLFEGNLIAISLQKLMTLQLETEDQAVHFFPLILHQILHQQPCIFFFNSPLDSGFVISHFRPLNNATIMHWHQMKSHFFLTSEMDTLHLFQRQKQLIVKSQSNSINFYYLNFFKLQLQHLFSSIYVAFISFLKRSLDDPMTFEI